jgi:hypothetical protein
MPPLVFLVSQTLLATKCIGSKFIIDVLACLTAHSMPDVESGGVKNMWYSFEHGLAHFIVFNTETDYPDAEDEPGGVAAENAGPFAPSGTQLAWLENDLKNVDRCKTPWVIVGGHRPCKYLCTSVRRTTKLIFQGMSLLHLVLNARLPLSLCLTSMASILFFTVTSIFTIAKALFKLVG